MSKIILASKSPRRKDLLASLGIDFQPIASNTDENLSIKDPVKLVIELSKQKALDVAYQLDYDSIVIGADTIVYVDGNILGKPENEIDAFNKLKLLQGRSHQVYTGICLVKVPSYKVISDYAMTRVWIKSMKDQEIRNYIRTGEVMDKAGAYAIQGRGSLIVEKIEGCYYNVVGLPLNKLNEMLKQLDVDLMCI